LALLLAAYRAISPLSQTLMLLHTGSRAAMHRASLLSSAGG